jgi:hypothetical protein
MVGKDAPSDTAYLGHYVKQPPFVAAVFVSACFFIDM